MFREQLTLVYLWFFASTFLAAGVDGMSKEIDVTDVSVYQQMGRSIKTQVEDQKDTMRFSIDTDVGAVLNNETSEETGDIYDYDYQEMESNKISEARRRKKTMRFVQDTGIYGPCENELNELTIVCAQGGGILVYDPLHRPYGCTSLATMTSQCKKSAKTSLCVREYGRNFCFVVAPGWYWFLGYIDMNQIRRTKYFNVHTQALIFHDDRYNVGGLPPMPSNVTLQLMAGMLYVHIYAPKTKRRLVLGYRVSFMDTYVGRTWDINIQLDAVAYRCSFPETRPIHPCGKWKSTRVLCVLLVEPIYWTLKKIYFGDKFVKVESTFAPHIREAKWYSAPYVVKLQQEVEDLAAVPLGPMFGLGNMTSTAEPPELLDLTYYPYLWAVFLGLALALIFGGGPLVYYAATRAGAREAEAVWREWADAPGNLCVGVGTEAIAWQGTAPWRLRAAV